MGQVIFVVWRESFEALLVVGIIYAWIKQHPDSATGQRYLWGGIALGVALSLFLAMLIYGIFNSINDRSQTYLMIAMSLFSSVLIVQMVYWMQKQSVSLTSGIEDKIKHCAQQHRWWGIVLIVAFAITREGSEIVVFLSAILMGLTKTTLWPFVCEVISGITFAAITFYLFLYSYRKVSWKLFFRLTGVILLFLACSLLLKSSEEIINLLTEYDIELIDFLIYPLWNSQKWLDDAGVFGSLLASLIGYRSQPVGLSVITFMLYWSVIFYLLKRKDKHCEK